MSRRCHNAFRFDLELPGLDEFCAAGYLEMTEPAVPGQRFPQIVVSASWVRFTLDRLGNPNVLTLDQGTSRLAQGCSAQTALVEVERYHGAPPPITAFEPPQFAPRGAGRAA